MKKVVMLLLCGSLLYGCSSSQYSVKVSDHEDALVTGSELNITKQDYFEYLLQNYGAQTVVSSMLDQFCPDLLFLDHQCLIRLLIKK